ncbi:hypothetical protein ACH5RR_019858 [Cinchona calisaya]|uniref:RRM domain-containing protein n=1 Tax=Cinchona calisaya TaxID=153742 RepID=A0ABD2ZQM8_9GENT
MSFGIIHRDVEWEWEESEWTYVYLYKIGVLQLRPSFCLHSLGAEDEWLFFSIHVGNLPSDIKESEVEDLFYKYGRILDIELKIPPRPPCYCFVEFESVRDAEDAIRGRDGYNFDGCKLRVELAHGGRGPSSSSDRRSGYGGGSGGSGGGGGRYGISRHSEFRVIVRGLPSSASWQDLKDHMRQAGEVCFAEVPVMARIRKLDDSEFRNPWTRTYIRVKGYKGSPSRSRSRSRCRSRSPRRNRSKSLDRSASRSPSKSRSASPIKSSRSKSRSRSASPRQWLITLTTGRSLPTWMGDCQGLPLMDLVEDIIRMKTS